VACVSHVCWLSTSLESMRGEELVEADGVEEVGADPVSSMVAAGRGSLTWISASQSFSAKMSVAASSQLR